MQVGILGIFQNYQGREPDAVMLRDEIRLAELAEPLGYDSYWPPEHHFTDYSACPDNVLFLTWLAARTTRLRLGTGAVIVPWNDPLRVAEKIALLDHLSGGRALLGLGRGLARIEYRHFGIEMAEARARFDEAAPMILAGLETGFVEGAGPFYPQLRTPIRPRPLASFRERLFCVGLSAESVDAAARLGARLMTLTQQPWEMYAQGTLAHYRESWRKHQAGEAPPPLVGDLMVCDASAERADALSREFVANYFLTITHHYELMSEHFAKTPGYQHYASSAELFRQVGLEVAAEGYRGLHCWGSPRQILEKLEARRRLVGPFDLLVIPRYGGMPIETAEASLRLFAAEVLPELRSW